MCAPGRLGVAVLCIVLFQGAGVLRADPAFIYPAIADPIQSASFSIDFAAMNAHRSVGGYETNFAKLVDCGSGGLPDLDLSDALFGTAAYPASPQIDMGALQTGIVSVPIDAAFFPALAGGQVGLRALLTDTDDAMFAMDFIGLTVQTNAGTLHSYYGTPIGNENNGFGIGLPDGGDLPSPLPISIPIGATGTGFDETISSKAILAIPEPATAWLAVAGLAALRRIRHRR